MASHALYYDFVHKKITGKDFKLVLSNVLQATTSSNHFFRRGKRNTSKSSTIAARRERTRINVREHDTLTSQQYLSLAKKQSRFIKNNDCLAALNTRRLRIER